MIKSVERAFSEHAAVHDALLKGHAAPIEEAARAMAARLVEGGKLVFFGNGLSSALASQLAASFVNRLGRERPPLPALSISADQAVTTGLADETAFSEVFALQLKALAKEGDVAVALSAGGGSTNLAKALDAARRKNLHTIAFTSSRDARLKEKADQVFVVPSENPRRIHEAQLTLGLVLCQLVEEILFEQPRKK